MGSLAIRLLTGVDIKLGLPIKEWLNEEASQNESGHVEKSFSPP